MANEILFTIDKPNVPSGVVLIEDVASLAKGLQDSILRLIQVSLGYQRGKRIRSETKKLAPIGLIDVKEGSGILDFKSLPIDGYQGRLPAMIAATEIVQGIQTFKDTGKWPSYMSSYVRSQLGSAIEPIIEWPSTIILSVSENDTPKNVTIDKPLSQAMQELESISEDTPIEIVGRIYDINIDSKTFKIDASQKRVLVEADQEIFNRADSLRWKRVFLVGIPMDEKCHRVGDVQELRAASEDEEDGISDQCAISLVESTPEYQQVGNKIHEFSEYENNWDSYGAKPPDKQILRYSLAFIRDAFTVLSQYEISTPNTFAVPTIDGGTQFEWEVENRALELEIVGKDTFKYLKIDGDSEIEGDAIKWQAIRLIRWVLTGEGI